MQSQNGASSIRSADGIRIRRAVADDISTIAAIEAEQFPNPWQETFFRSELSNQLARFYTAVEAETDTIVGFIVFWIIQETMELHDIAVTESHKRKGVGAALMHFMLETGRREKVEEIFLEVRAGNASAIGFYEAFQFQRLNRRKKYYKDPVEDALVYRLRLPSAPSASNDYHNDNHDT